jgi:membrane complex biogenesis BtpA family protein
VRTLPPRFLAGMIALAPLPGSPRYGGDDGEIRARALSDLEAYSEVGLDVVVLENSHDVPYVKPPFDGAALSLVKEIAADVRAGFAGPIGIQLLEAANLEALEVAAECGLDFVRVEGFVFAHVGGAGLIEGCAGELLRLRRRLGARDILVFADIHKKHCSHALTGDLDIVDELRQAEFFDVDGVIVTGTRTEVPPDPLELATVAGAARVPVIVGSGMTPENIATYIPHADGFIVGSCLRTHGRFMERLDTERLRRFVDAFREAGRVS